MHASCNAQLCSTRQLLQAKNTAQRNLKSTKHNLKHLDPQCSSVESAPKYISGMGAKFGRSFGLTTCGRSQFKLIL